VKPLRPRRLLASNSRARQRGRARDAEKGRLTNTSRFLPRKPGSIPALGEISRPTAAVGVVTDGYARGLVCTRHSAQSPILLPRRTRHGDQSPPPGLRRGWCDPQKRDGRERQSPASHWATLYIDG
jgi:hypothetical protein